MNQLRRVHGDYFLEFSYMQVWIIAMWRKQRPVSWFLKRLQQTKSFELCSRFFILVKTF